jgi:threonylcarbamoyladenosine tRNA methylthiotransferase MtaB
VIPPGREPQGIEVLTFGCRLNLVESEAMRRAALACGRTNLVIVNTCAVTAEAARQGRQAIRRVKRARPGAEIVVTGCAAQIDPNQFAAMPEVFRVLGNADKADPASWTGGGGSRVEVSSIMAAKAAPTILSEGIEDRTRAFLAVQTGCDHRCSFCVIPFGRGPSRSVPLDDVTRAAHRLAGNGFREIVLTGVDLTSYGADLCGAPALGRLVKAILHVAPGLARLRLSSIDCIEADEDLIKAFANETASSPRRCRALLRWTAPVAARNRVWRRSDRGLSDRDRSHVSKHARVRGGLRADASACVSVFRAARNAGRENAAGRA